MFAAPKAFIGLHPRCDERCHSYTLGVRFSPIRRLQFRYRRWQHDREWARTGVTDPQVAAERPMLWREHYFAFRKRLWEFRQEIPNWPRTLQFAISAVVVAAIVGTFFGVKALVTRSSTSSVAKGPGLAQAFSGAADDAASGQRKVLIVGDSTAFAFGFQSAGGYDGNGIHGVIYGSFLCGLAVGPVQINGKFVPLDKKCGNWPHEYRTVASNFKPDSSLVMVGVNDARARIVNGHQLPAQSKELEQYLDGQLDKARDALTSTGGKFGIINTACTGSNLAGNSDLVRWLDDVFKRYATAHHGVTVADYDQFACPGGASAHDKTGLPYLDARGSMTSAGASATWKWIATSVVPPQAKSGV